MYDFRSLSPVAAPHITSQSYLDNSCFGTVQFNSQEIEQVHAGTERKIPLPAGANLEKAGMAVVFLMVDGRRTTSRARARARIQDPCPS